MKRNNRYIYQKVEVSSRDELMLCIVLLRCCGRLGELTDQKPITELRSSSGCTNGESPACAPCTYSEDTFSLFAERVSSEPFYKIHFTCKMNSSKRKNSELRLKILVEMLLEKLSARDVFFASSAGSKVRNMATNRYIFKSRGDSKDAPIYWYLSHAQGEGIICIMF